MKHTPKPPAYLLDVDLVGDGSGRHIPGTPYVYTHGWNPIKGALKKAAAGDKSKGGKGDPFDVETHRTDLLTEVGHKLKYPDKSVDELHTMWSAPGTSPADKESLRGEIDARIKQLTAVSQAWDKDLTDTLRKGQRDGLTKWDERLSKLPGGKTVISLRDKILTDKVLERVDGIQDWMHDHGKAYAVTVATGLAIGLLLQPLGGAIAEFLNAGGREATQHMLSNVFVNSGLSVAFVGPASKLLGPIFKPLHKDRRLKKAAKYTAKGTPDVTR